MFACRLSYPACKANAPYYVVVCGFHGSTIFLKNITQKTWFSKKKLLNTKCVDVDILKRIYWNISFSTKYSARFYHKCISVFMLSTLYLRQILKNLELYRQILESMWILNYMKNITVGAHLLHTDGRIDRQSDGLDEVNTLYSQFYKNA